MRWEEGERKRGVKAWSVKKKKRERADVRVWWIDTGDNDRVDRPTGGKTAEEREGDRRAGDRSGQVNADGGRGAKERGVRRCRPDPAQRPPHMALLFVAPLPPNVAN